MKALLVLLLVAGVGVGGYYFVLKDRAEPPVATVTPVKHAPKVEASATPGPAMSRFLHPVNKAGSEAEIAEQAKVLPVLDKSDASFQDALAKILGSQKALANLNRDLIRRIVVTIDNATGKQFPVEFSPLKLLKTEFVKEEQDGTIWLSEKNYVRYKPYVKFLCQIDSQKWVSTYEHYYPLFQAAFRDLGTQGYFNDRLVEVIDHLLAAPTESGRIGLVQPKVFYEFSDPKLEALSAGQKIFLRMGPQNAAQLKAKLREIRLFLVK